MSFFRAVKKNAKLSLKGNWGGAIGVCAFAAAFLCVLKALELALLYSAADTPSGDMTELLCKVYSSGGSVGILITSGFLLLALLLLSPLMLGARRFFYLAICQESPRFRDIFRFFTSPRRYGRAVWYTVQLNLRCLLWGILFFALPSGLMLISIRFLSIDSLSRESRSVASVGVVLACGLFFLTAVLFAVFVQKYAVSAYLICQDDTDSARKALKDSIRYTKGHRVTLLLFSVSYFGLYFLTPFTFFLLLICYVLPYRAAAGMVIARYLCERYRLEQNILPEQGELSAGDAVFFSE